MSSSACATTLRVWRGSVPSSASVRTCNVPRRGLAGLGYLLAASLLIGSSFLRWSFALFPLWVLLLSIQILAGGLSRRAER